jgi:hypothetical protein
MIVVKLDKEEFQMVKYLRENHDINISSYLRKCIKERYNELKKNK